MTQAVHGMIGVVAEGPVVATREPRSFPSGIDLPPESSLAVM